MNTKAYSSNKNNDFIVRSVNKTKNNKKIFPSSSNIQETAQYNLSKNKSSSHKNKKSKSGSKSMLNYQNYNSEEFPKKFMGTSNENISTKINSDSNTNLNKNKKKKMNVNQYKEILHQKDKKIVELERQIKLYRDKLKNQITLININSSVSLNNFNLNKAQSSKNVIERNLGQIRSYSSSHAKIKSSSPMSNNMCQNKNKDRNDNYNNNKVNNNKNRNKKRAKSNDYKKEKINNLFFIKNLNEIKKQHNNIYFKNKIKSKNKNENNMNYRRAKSYNIEKIRNINNNITKPKANTNDKNNELLSIEETQNICDKMLEKMKKVLELVKITTTSEN